MINEITWLKNYKLALKYYQEHGHLMIITKYSCLDEDGNIVNLGNWIAHQRQYFKNGLLDKEHIDLLSRIGMICIIRNNKDSVKYHDDCEQLNNFVKKIGLK